MKTQLISGVRELEKKCNFFFFFFLIIVYLFIITHFIFLLCYYVIMLLCLFITSLYCFFFLFSVPFCIFLTTELSCCWLFFSRSILSELRSRPDGWKFICYINKNHQSFYHNHIYILASNFILNGIIISLSEVK